MQFGIFVLVEAREINLRDNVEGSKCNGDFYEDIFRFTKKFLPFLTLHVFFEIFLPQPPVFLTDLY